MTLSIRSSRLYGPAAVSTSIVTVITVPAGHAYVVKDVKLARVGGLGNATFTMYLDSGSGNQTVWFAVLGTGTALVVDPFRLTLAAGDKLALQCNVASAMYATLDGFDFTN